MPQTTTCPTKNTEGIIMSTSTTPPLKNRKNRHPRPVPPPLPGLTVPSLPNPPAIARCSGTSVQITPYGGVHSLEAHLVAYGIAAMFEGSRLSYADRDISVTLPYDVSDVHATVEHYVRLVVDPSFGWACLGAGSPPKAGSSAQMTTFAASPFQPAIGKLYGWETPNNSAEDMWKSRYSRRDSVIHALSVANPLAEKVISAMGRPAHWRPEDKGCTQLMPRIANGGVDQFLGSTVIPAVEAALHTQSGAKIIEAIEHGDDASLVLQPEFSSQPSPVARTVIGVYGLWALPTHIGVGIPARTVGCVYVAGKTYARNNALTVLPVFSSPVSVARVRTVVSNALWLPTYSDKRNRYVIGGKSRAWALEQGVRKRVMFSVGQWKIGEKSTAGVPVYAGELW